MVCIILSINKNVLSSSLNKHFLPRPLQILIPYTKTLQLTLNLPQSFSLSVHTEMQYASFFCFLSYVTLPKPIVPARSLDMFVLYTTTFHTIDLILGKSSAR